MFTPRPGSDIYIRLGSDKKVKFEYVQNGRSKVSHADIMIRMNHVIHEGIADRLHIHGVLNSWIRLQSLILEDDIWPPSLIKHFLPWVSQTQD